MKSAEGQTVEVVGNAWEDPQNPVRIKFGCKPLDGWSWQPLTRPAPVWPELPPEILQANPAFLDDNATKTKGWYPSPASAQYGRSLYLVQKRTVRIPLLETLDLPENSVSCARRESSIVAPQVLSLLNGDLAVTAAETLAGRIAAEADGDAALAVQAAFHQAFQRAPSDEEQRLAQRFVTEHSLTELCRALLNANELMFVP